MASLERSLGEVNRVLDKKLVSDQIAFRVLGGLASLVKLLNLIAAESKETPLVIPSRFVPIYSTTNFLLRSSRFF